MSRVTNWLFFILLLSAVFGATTHAATTWTAASCSQVDVTFAINNALQQGNDGDIVQLPACNVTWTGGGTSSFTMSKSLTIQGMGAISATTGGAGTTGTDQTIITDNNSGVTSLAFTTVAGKSLRITGIAYRYATGRAPSNDGLWRFGGSGTTLRIDHNHFYTIAGCGIIGLGGAVTGVADHNYFESPSDVLNMPFELLNGANWNGETAGLGDKSWADTEHWGSSQFLFIEDNRFRNGDIGDAVFGAARFVIRYNTIAPDIVGGSLQGQLFWHGIFDGRWRPTRAAEIYQNAFIQPGPIGYGYTAIPINGGTALVWGNTVTQYRWMMEIGYTRKDNSTYNYGSPPTGWGNCNGTSGTVWDGPGGYPCMDQPGRGAGDLLSGYPISATVNRRTGTQAWVQQALSPIYIWGNTYTPAGGYSPTGQVNAGPSAMIAANREYYHNVGASCSGANCLTGIGSGTLAARPPNCTAGPGGNTPGVGYWATDQNTLYVCTATNTWSAYYTPYTYPHPLVSGPTAAPAAPTTLQVK